MEKSVAKTSDFIIKQEYESHRVNFKWVIYFYVFNILFNTAFPKSNLRLWLWLSGALTSQLDLIHTLINLNHTQLDLINNLLEIIRN